MPNRILSYEKIVKGEGRGKWETKFSFLSDTEPYPAFLKDTRKMQSLKYFVRPRGDANGNSAKI